MAGQAQLLVRFALAITATAVAFWAAGSLRAVDREQAATELLGSKAKASPSEVARARTGFGGARAFNDDTEVLVREAASLLLIGRRDAATAPARRATRAEPENFVAWLALYRATSGSDRRTASVAKRRALALDPSAARLLARMGAD